MRRTSELPVSGLTQEALSESCAAAKRIEPRVEAIRERVFKAIEASGDDGITDREIQEKLGLHGNTQRPRRWELWIARRIRAKRNEKGEVIYRRYGPGSKCIVWVVGQEHICPTCGNIYTKTYVAGQFADATDQMLPATQEEKKHRTQKCLEPLQRKVAKCQKCPHLARSRKQTVFGEGDLDAELAFVGEAPGEDEDRQGRPFVGRAGKLLTQVINRLGFYRRQVYICNVLKCRPDAASGNRRPTRAEMLECLPYLKAQLGQVRPKVIVILGGTALEAMLEPDESISRLRGQVLEWQGTPAIPTWHPAYVLRNPTPQTLREFWSDCLEAIRLLGYEVRRDDALWLPRVRA